VRFVEISMLLLPLAAFVAWRLMSPAGGPPRMLVIGVTGTAVLLALALLVFWYEEAEPPGTNYVPARQENGQIVPPRVGPAGR
jgi:hypothetical protein